jgi:hypothetical protein
MTGVRWQRNFFDHRLRHDESLAEKFAYVCQNPLRAGLIRNELEWPYISSQVGAICPAERQTGASEFGQARFRLDYVNSAPMSPAFKPLPKIRLVLIIEKSNRRSSP